LKHVAYRKTHLTKNKTVVFSDYDHSQFDPTIKGYPSHLEFHGTVNIIDSEIVINMDNNISETVKPISYWIGFYFHGCTDMALAECKGGDFTVSVKIPDNPEHRCDVVKCATFIDMVDPETGSEKLFPLQTCGVPVEDLRQDKCFVSCNDEWNPALRSEIRIICSNIDKAPQGLFSRSSLRDIPEYNKALEEMMKNIVGAMNKNNMRPPKAAVDFALGKSYAPLVGMPSQGIPPMMTQYGLLNEHIMNLNRPVPIPVLCYFFHMALQHSGYTLDELTALKDKHPKRYASFIGKVLWGFTKDSFGVRYQRDATPNIGVTGIGETISLGVTLTTSEDMNIIMTRNSLACECKNQIDKSVKPDIHKDKSMANLKKEFFKQEWEEQSRCLGKDDCESSSFAGCMAFTTVKNTKWSAQTIKKELKGYDCFKNWTDGCCKYVCGFFQDVQNHINTGKLTVSIAIGIAGSASAGDQVGATKTTDENDIENFEGGGHCFSLMKYQPDPDQSPMVEILEGTNSVQTIPSEFSQEWVMHIKPQECPADAVPIKEFKLQTCGLACAASRIMSMLTQVCNQSMEGGEAGGLGWKGDKQVACAKTVEIAMPSLDCTTAAASGVSKKIGKKTKLAKKEKIPFYQWCMYNGFKVNESGEGFGCLPSSIQRFKDGMVGAGCSPGDLGKEDLMGISLGTNVIEKKHMDMGNKIWNEMLSPMGTKDQFQKVLNAWNVCCPLHEVNQEAKKMKQEGMDYLVVNAMESPAAPCLVDLIYEAKKIVVDEVNRLNDGKDGAFMTVFKNGTGVTVSGYFPVSSGEKKSVTLLQHLMEAVENTGFSTV
jgi:hypothetical protein